jgi:Xaa-Pro aminopeptidase
VTRGRAASRLGAIQEAMYERDVDVVVIGPTSSLRYALGFRALPTDRLTALVVSRESSVMIMPDFEAPEFVEATGFEQVVPWADRIGPAPAVAEAFAKLGTLPSEPVAAVDDELPFQFFTHLRGHLGVEPALASSLIGELRLIKSADEQRRIAATGALISAAIDFFYERVAPGMTEVEVKRLLEGFLWDGGSDTVDYVLVQAGANSSQPHHSADSAVLADGEPVLVDIAVCLDGYFADITQQAFLGEPTAEYTAAYGIVSAAQAAGVAATIAGAKVEDVAKAASAVIADAGYAEWSGPRTGHGLGADVHEAPSVVEGNEALLQPGYVITVEPGVYVPGRWGIRIEDTVIVGEDGPRCVTRGARPLFVKAGG